MTRRSIHWLAGFAILCRLATSAAAQGYGEYPPPSPGNPFPHSARTGEFAKVPCYGALPIRVQTTPTTGPYYNVPPYHVIAPY